MTITFALNSWFIICNIWILYKTGKLKQLIYIEVFFIVFIASFLKKQIYSIALPLLTVHRDRYHHYDHFHHFHNFHHFHHYSHYNHYNHYNRCYHYHHYRCWMDQLPFRHYEKVNSINVYQNGVIDKIS